MNNTDTISEVLKELKKVTAQNNEIKQQNEEIKKEVLNIRKELENETKELKNTIKELKDENDKLKERIIRTERQLKKYNIIIHGLKEDHNENLENTVCTFLQQNLNIELTRSSVRNIYRIGQENPQKLRPILMELQGANTKQEIIKNCYKLKGTGKYISHDLTSEDLEKNNILWNYRKKALEQDIDAKVVKGTLMVDGKIYSFEDIKSDILSLKIKEVTDIENEERNTRQKTKRAREEHTVAEQSSKKNKNK